MNASPAWRQSGGIRWLQADLGGASVAFSTRDAGDLRQPGNRDAFASVVGRDPAGVITGRQVHGTVIDRRGEAGAQPADADGQQTSNSATTPAVLVADCLPVAVAAPGVVAMVHCGWRGLAAGIVAEAVAGIGDSQSARVVIGPGIGPCCYEVGDEVIEAFAARGHAAGRMLDLKAIACAELQAAGIAPGAIEDMGLCTSCKPELFFSYRRDADAAGRQAGMAWLR